MNKRRFLFLLILSLTSGIVLKACRKRFTQPGKNSLGIDINQFFHDGFSFQYDFPSGIPSEGTTLQTVSISVQNIGNLAIISGKLFACDPLLEPYLNFYFSESIPTGEYPVLLSLAKFTPRDDVRVAYAMLRISSKPIQRWEVAKVHAQNPKWGEIYGYGVDSGIGSFMDQEAAVALNILASPDPDEYEKARLLGSDATWTLTRQASERFEREYCDRVIQALETNSVYGLSASWANIQVNESTNANVMAFSSGWGDGGYQSYWGYDDQGSIAALVTDFYLFG